VKRQEAVLVAGSFPHDGGVQYEENHAQEEEKETEVGETVMGHKRETLR
jgi:hypothetical protein